MREYPPTGSGARATLPGHAQETVLLKPCPDGHAEHRLIHVDHATIVQMELPPGSLLHLDMQRRPRDGDLVLAEVVISERLTRSVRRFTAVGGSSGVVSLARLGPRATSIIRPRYEVGILGVVDGHIVPLDGS
jgi:hypothetical protein